MDTYEQMNRETRGNIESGFINILKEKSFRKTTIQDISNAAQVNRSTFYHHYLDKYDLCEQMIKEMLLELETLLNNIDHHELITQMDDDSKVYCYTIFHFIEEHQDTFKVLVDADLPFNFLRHLKKLLMQQFNQTSIKLFESSGIPETYIANFAASALLGLVEAWMDEDFKDSSETVTQYFLDIIQTIRTI
ncbi:TetR/AcrR family transcriptional regulator [Macrococcus equi]|uniref:TetR/AcrR family transcriptional regulator n=1 Tax=Macrococcus equi TaxID=3395462 RepID=UPI0039BE6DF2